MRRGIRWSVVAACGLLVALAGGPTIAAEPDSPTQPDRSVSGVRDVDPDMRGTSGSFDRRDRMTPAVSAGYDDLAADPSQSDPDDPRSGRGARKTDKQVFR